MSFPRRGRGGGGNSGAPNPLASLPYVRQGVAPPAQLYPPFRGAYADADGADALAPAQTEGLPQSLYPCVPLAPGSRDRRAVEAQLLLRQRMRLSAFYLTRAAALASRKRDTATSSAGSGEGASASASATSTSTDASASATTGIDAAVVVMAEALPAARALVPAELLEAGAVRRHDAHRPPRKRARGAGGDVDVEGLFSSLAQEEAREGQAGPAGQAPGHGEEKDGDDDESDVEGSDGGDAEDESDADDGDYDMGQYGSDEDGGDDYGDAGGDDGDDGDDGGYD